MIGVVVEYFQDRCFVYKEKEIIEYSVEEMLHEYLYCDISQLKELIVNSTSFHEQYTPENREIVLAELVHNGFGLINTKHEIQFFDYLTYFTHFDYFDNESVDEEILAKVFENTPCTSLEDTTMGCYMLKSLYNTYAIERGIVNIYDEAIMKNSTADVEPFLTAWMEKNGNIQYKMIYRDGAIRKVYELQNGFSLLFLSLAKYFQQHT